MATITILHDIPIGETEHLYTGVISMDSSYPTGGEALDATGNSSFDVLLAQPRSGYVFQWSQSAQKLLAYQGKDPGATGGADIPLQEVPNTTDLSAVTNIQFIAVGQ